MTGGLSHATSSCGASEGGRLSDFISLGVLARTFPLDAVERVLEQCGKSARRRRDLPSFLVVYYVIALPLFMQVSTREVLRCLLEGWRWLWGPQSWRVVGKSWISKARSRLGEEPLRRMFETLVRPLAGSQMPGAFCRRWRLISFYGGTLAVADTEANAAAFGYPGVSRGEPSFPLLRWTCLVETGTHVMSSAAAAGCRTGEETLARKLLPDLTAGMLSLADRNFLSHELWRLARQQGADLLWRARKSVLLPCLERFPDGSFRSELRPRRSRGQPPGEPLAVRVIEYELQGVETLRRAIAWSRRSSIRSRRRLRNWLRCIRRGVKSNRRSARPRPIWAARRTWFCGARNRPWYGKSSTGFCWRTLSSGGCCGNRPPASQQDVDRLSFVHAVRIVRRKISSPGAIPPREPSRSR